MKYLIFFILSIHFLASANFEIADKISTVDAKRPVSLGLGLSVEFLKITENFPGINLSFKNFLQNNNYSFIASLDFFRKIKNSNYQLDITSKLNYKFISLKEVSFNAAAGPGVRTSFDRDSSKISFLHFNLMFSMEQIVFRSLILETAIENKIGFFNRPDIIFSFRIYKTL